MAKTMDDFLLDAIHEINENMNGDPYIGLTDSLEHWHGYGIYTPKELFWYLDYTTFSDVWKSIYGIRPRGLNWSHAEVLEWLENVAEEQEEEFY